MIKFTELRSGSEARQAVLNGVRAVVDTVKTTLGADARNVLTDKKGKARVSDDGVTIASGIVLKDPHQNSAAQAVTEAAKRTREMVGDGTTTSMVLTGAIVEEALDRTTLGDNPMKLKRQIKESFLKAVDELKIMARPVKTEEDVINVAKVSLLDDELGEIVGKMVYKVGVNGFVSVEENLKYGHEFETIDGMKVDGTYAAPLFVTNEKKEAIFQNSPIIVVNGEIDNFNVIYYILNVTKSILNKDSIIILASRFSNEVVREILRIVLKHNFPILPLKAPALTEEQLEDIAVFTGGKFFDQNVETLKITSKDGQTGGEHGNAARKEHYGFVKKIKADRDFITIISESEDKESIRCRIEMLKEHLKLESDQTLKNKTKRRIASMSEGVGIIKVGLTTEMERNYLFKKVENAVASAKAAMEEGIVQGGGMTLKAIAEKLEKEDPKNILIRPLKKPYEQLRENAGEEKETGDNVIDPVKVTRIALENACSIASILITTASTCVWHNNSLEQEFHEIMNDRESFSKYDPEDPDRAL